MKNVLLVFIGFVVGTVSVFLFITHGVEKQLGKNEPVKVETKPEEDIERAKKSFEEFTTSIHDLSSKEVIMPKPEVKTEVGYLFGEKKECEDKGGLFQIDPDFTNYVMGTGYTDDYSVTCIKKYQEGNKNITETIFDYKI